MLFSGWQGHFWAEPDEKHLRELLRDVHSNPDSAREKGKRARTKMVSEYSLLKLREILNRELSRIFETQSAKLLSKKEL